MSPVYVYFILWGNTALPPLSEVAGFSLDGPKLCVHRVDLTYDVWETPRAVNDNCICRFSASSSFQAKISLCKSESEFAKGIFPSPHIMTFFPP